MTLLSLIPGALAIALFNWDRLNRARRGHPAWALRALVPYVLGLFYLV